MPRGAEAAIRLLWGIPFTTRSLRSAFLQIGVDRVAISDKPIVSFQEIEGAVDELSGFGVRAAVELTLDAVFGGGVEDEAHGVSVPPRFGVGQWRYPNTSLKSRDIEALTANTMRQTGDKEMAVLQATQESKFKE